MVFGYNPWHLISLMAQPESWVFVSIFLFLVYFLLRRRGIEKEKFRHFLSLLFLSMFVSFSLVLVLKSTVSLPRPCVPCPAEACNPYCPKDSGFPSGHSAVGFVVFTSLYLVLGRKKFLPIFVLPVLVAVSRVMLGVHTITDIVAGGLLGLMATIIIDRILLKEKLNLF